MTPDEIREYADDAAKTEAESAVSGIGWCLVLFGLAGLAECFLQNASMERMERRIAALEAQVPHAAAAGEKEVSDGTN